MKTVETLEQEEADMKWLELVQKQLKN
jgi:hypothetical protein